MEIVNGAKSSCRKIRKRKALKRTRKQRKNSKDFAIVVTKESLKRVRRGKVKTWVRIDAKVLSYDGLATKRKRGSCSWAWNPKTKRKDKVRVTKLTILRSLKITIT